MPLTRAGFADVVVRQVQVQHRLLLPERRPDQRAADVAQRVPAQVQPVRTHGS